MRKGIVLVVSCLFISAISLTQLEREVLGQGTEKAKVKGVLYSRYEELARAVNPSFSVKLSERYSNSKSIDSYPPELAGVWGGKLKLYRTEITDLKKRIDPHEVEKTARCFKVGRECNINFEFEKDKTGKLKFLPATGVFMVPAGESDEVQQLIAKNSDDPIKASLLKDMLATKEIPISYHLGPYVTSTDSKSFGGASVVSRLVCSSSHELEKNTFEEQILCKTSETFPNKSIRRNFSEVAIWFKLIPEQDYIYARVAELSFSEKGQLHERAILAGTLSKGRRMQTDSRTLIHQSFH